MSALHLKGRWGQGLEGGLPDAGEDTVLDGPDPGASRVGAVPQHQITELRWGGGLGGRKKSSLAEWGGHFPCLRDQPLT